MLLASLLVLLTTLASACSPRGARPAPPPAPAGTDSATAAERAAGTGSPAVAAEDLEYLRGRALMVPVQGVRAAKIPDSFDDRRGTTRRHNAIDIMAARGTPVLSADDGRVYKLRTNAAGGTTIYAVDPESRFVYYYAHLDRYREGLSEGAPLAKGEVIGYVGSTGNASEKWPHLHFQVMRLTTVRRYWDGVPVNPKPYFAIDGPVAPTATTTAASAAASQPQP